MKPGKMNTSLSDQINTLNAYELLRIKVSVNEGSPSSETSVMTNLNQIRLFSRHLHNQTRDFGQFCGRVLGFHCFIEFSDALKFDSCMCGFCH